MDWILQKIFKLPPPLEGHRSEQVRISNPGLSFLREVALVLQKMGDCDETFSTAELASYCEAGGIEVPGCKPGTDNNVIIRRIGSLLGPLFRESESIEVEGFVVRRTKMSAYNEERKENVEKPFYCFEPQP
jgi:hypothetical protein